MTQSPDTYSMTSADQSAARRPRVDDVARHARLDAWFRTYGDRVLAYLLHRTDRQTAEDVLQEVFVTAFRRAAEVPEPPIGWLLGTARRLLANATRGEQRRDRLALRVAGSPSFANAASDDGAAPTSDVVVAALAEMSARDREVLTLSAWYELSGDEAAQVLGCTPAAYAVRLHRARHRLADRLRAAGYAQDRWAELPEVGT
jgi:RNA polymerase sigma-70 factor (ECF subfamily)